MRNRIQELRKERKITQNELADELEVTRQTIISLENGRYNASLLLAHKIAAYFGMSIEEVFYLKKMTERKYNRSGNVAEPVVSKNLFGI